MLTWKVELTPCSTLHIVEYAFFSWVLIITLHVPWTRIVADLLCQVDVKAAALHALASALGEPRSASPSPSASEPSQNEREERSRLARALMDRLGTCNRQSPGAMIVGLAKQPVPEVWHIIPIRT